MLLVTNCGFQGHVGGNIVMMKPVIFSQASQNVTVRIKVRVDRSVRRNKFTVNNPLHINKNKELALCWIPGLPHLFCSWWLWAPPLRWLLLCFWIITANPTCHPLWSLRKVGSSLAFYHSSRQMFTHLCFWSFVKSQGTNFAAVQRMLKVSVKISWQTP
jgi:hypothetical protein